MYPVIFVKDNLFSVHQRSDCISLFDRKSKDILKFENF